MNTTNCRFSSLLQAVKEGASISIDRQEGTWQRRSKIAQIFRWIFGLENQDNLELASFVKRYVKTHEISPLYITKGLYADRDVSEQDIQEAVHAVKARLQHGRSNANKTKILKLERHAYALQTRSNCVPPDDKEQILEADRIWLYNTLTDWKGVQFPSLPHNISSEDKKKLDTILQYKGLIPLLQNDEVYRKHFFKFVFNSSSDSCPDVVHIAVQFPQLAKRLTHSFLNKRINRIVHTPGLIFCEKILPDGQIVKDVRMRMKVIKDHTRAQSTYKSLRDLSKPIALYNNSHPTIPSYMTVDTIFREFEEKNKVKMGNLEYTEEGVGVYNPSKCPLDFEKSEWWKDLPALERLTPQQIQERYGIDITQHHSLLLVNATRSKVKNSAEGNHAWITVFIPQADGTFTTHAIGKYVPSYPQTTLEKLAFTCQTAEATMSVIDENEFYLHRERCTIPKELSSKQFHSLMDTLKVDLKAAQDRKMLFQHQGDNCAAWVQQTLDTVFGKANLPRLFEMSIFDVATPFPVNFVLRSFKWLNDHVSETVARIVRIAFTGICGQELSLMRNKLWYDGILQVPGKLFERKEVVRSALKRLS